MQVVFKHQTARKDTSIRDYYYRNGDDRFYKRIWAGICPPSVRPGAIVVVAEELTLRPPAHIFWVDEALESATGNLLQRTLDYKAAKRAEKLAMKRMQGESEIKTIKFKGMDGVTIKKLEEWCKDIASHVYNISYPHENEKKWNLKANLYLNDIQLV